MPGVTPLRMATAEPWEGCRSSQESYGELPPVRGRVNRGPHGKDGSERQHRVAGGEEDDGEGKETKILVTRTFQEVARGPVRHPRLAG